MISVEPDARLGLVPGVLSVVRVDNAHGAMGFFGHSTALLVVLAFVVLGVLAFALRDGLRASAAAQAGFGAIAGGAAGNAIDRLVHGYVVDFLSLRGFPWVFNVADLGITAGLVVLVATSLRSARA